MTIIRANIAALILATLGMILLLSGCASQGVRKTDMDQPPSSQRTTITSVAAVDNTNGTRVIISADSPLTFSSLKQPDPLAVVLYFPETTVEQLPSQQMVDSKLISRVLARDGNGNHTARMEIQLAADAAYTAKQDGNNVRLTFIKNNAVSLAPDRAAEGNPTSGMTKAAYDSNSPQQGPSSVQTVAADTPPVNTSGKTAWVNKIDFLSQSQGKSTLVVGTTHAVDYKINKVAPRKLEIRLLNTRIPKYRQRPLITTRFTSAVDRVIPFQPAKQRAETVISVDMRESVPYSAEQTDSVIMVHFEASSIPPKPMEQTQMPAWKQVISGAQDQMTTPQSPVTVPSKGATIAQPQPLAEQPVGESEAAMEDELMREDIEVRSLLAPRRRHYTGEKIALDFYETDIKNVFRILREVSGKNFAIDKDVTGKVTMTLDKPVPWDQVLDLVLRMNQLGMSHEGNIIRIATVETLKKEEDLRKAKLEALKQAREDAKALEPLITKYIPVSYSNAKDEVQPHIEKILTKDRGSVTVDEKNNQVIITDTADKVRQAQNIVKRIDKVTAQVIIEGRVVEVTSNFSRELGIDWDLSYGPGLIPGLDWRGSTDMAMNFPATGADSSVGISFSRLSGVPFVLNARLNALETTGKGKVLSAPKILTLDNKKARIKQGIEVGYLERDSAGGSSVKFKNVDLLLEVTPHVTPDNRISLVIYITKNDVADIINGVPSVSSNEAQTELLVNDGDTVVIGGIIKKTESQGSSGFPGLSRIPLLGWMFKNNTNREQKNELLIFITPRIVQLEQSLAQSN